MRVLIVDDEAPARARLRRLLMVHADVQVVGEAGDGEAALAQVAAWSPDAVFLDVQMPAVSGLDVAASLPDGGPALVFVTAHDRYALPAFDAAALDYLLKPVEPERLARAVQRLRDRAVARGPARAERLLVSDRGRTRVLPVAQIEWLAAADNYVEIHAAGAPWLLRRTLTGLLADLGDTFVRIHRSRAVALARVTEVRTDDKGDMTVRLDSGVVLQGSRAWRAGLATRL